jgi:ferritin-like metal-binding protein YciE
MVTLQDLYQAELDDLYDAEQQILSALPKLSAASKNADLKAAFDKHLERSRIHVERLDLIFKRANRNPSGTRSAGIEGLIREGDRRIKAASDGDTRDAALIAAAQHVEHYEIAGYGCARTYARQLGDEDAADLLQQTLDEEGAADKELTNIAQSGINQAAGRTAPRDTPQWSRLRYVNTDDFSGEAFDARDLRVRNRAGDDLGDLDGFIVDTSGRPYYFVVDSGGWFTGRRYLLPVGNADFDSAARSLITDINKDTLKRYPEFHPQAFMAMTDEEVRRYEWRVLEAVDPQAARRTPQMWRYEEFEYYRTPPWLGTERTWSQPRQRSTADVSRAAEARIPRPERTRVPAEDREAVIAREEGPDAAREPALGPGSDLRSESRDEARKRERGRE